MTTIIILLLIKIVIGEDISAESFINLLPEEERKEFIDHIFRRILTDVKTNDNASSGPEIEMPDSELDTYETYVSKILKEEILNKTQHHDPIYGKVNRDDKNIIFLNSLTGYKRDQLNLRAGNRNKRNVNSDKVRANTFNTSSEKLLDTEQLDNQHESFLNKNDSLTFMGKYNEGTKTKNESDDNSSEYRYIENNNYYKKLTTESIPASTSASYLTTNESSYEESKYFLNIDEDENKTDVESSLNTTTMKNSHNYLSDKTITDSPAFHIITNGTTNKIVNDDSKQLGQVYDINTATKIIFPSSNQNNVSKMTNNLTAIKHNVTAFKYFQILPKSKVEVIKSINDTISLSSLKQEKFKEPKSEYRVNEIDKSSLSEFTTADSIQIMQERPQYISVYNYMPSNAYFSALNRLDTKYGSKENAIKNDYNPDLADKFETSHNELYKYVLTDLSDQKLKLLDDDIIYPMEKLEDKLFQHQKQQIYPELSNAYIEPVFSVNSKYNPRESNTNSLKQILSKLYLKESISKILPLSDSVNYSEVVDSISMNNIKNQIKTIRNKIYRRNGVILLNSQSEKEYQENENLLEPHKSIIPKYFQDVNDFSEINNYINNNNQNNANKFQHFQQGLDNLIEKVNDIKRMLISITSSWNGKVKNTAGNDMIEPYKTNKDTDLRDSDDIVIKINDDKVKDLNLFKNEKQNEYSLIYTTEPPMKIKESLPEKNNFILYLNILRDMISLDDKGLQQYNWLGTTVDIEAAIHKLLYLTKDYQAGNNLHPSDLQLLKYATYLHAIATDESNSNTKLSRRVSQSDWTRYSQIFRRNAKDFLVDFKQFLENLRKSLNVFHDAIKHIAIVRKRKAQKMTPFYQSIKQVYIYDMNDRTLMPMVLHLMTVRALDLIEESSKDGMEYDYGEYIRRNKKIVTRTVQELRLILEFIKEIENNSY